MSDTQPVIQELEPRQETSSQNGTAPEAFSSKSKTIGKLAAALAAAQLEYQPILKETENPYYNSRYADLAAILAATQPALAKQALVVIQTPIIDLEHQKAGVETVLAHASDEYITTKLLLPATMKGRDGVPRFDAQSVGAALTYSRRYTYQALVGVAAEMDDDANTISVPRSAEAQKAVAEKKMEAHAKGESITPTLTYEWEDESQTAKISGPEALKQANRDLLAKYWSPGVKAIVVNGDQLEDLKFQMEQRGIGLLRVQTKKDKK